MILLVDADDIAARNYFAFQEFQGISGQNCGMVYGFTQSLGVYVNRYVPQVIVCCWGDRRANLWRRKVYPEYKVTRDEKPEKPDYGPQVLALKRLLSAMGVPQALCLSYEADDLLAALAKYFFERGNDVSIVTKDHDLMQLVRDGSPYIKVICPAQKGYEMLDEKKVKEKIGVAPTMIPLMYSITGERGDNVAGISGVGPKTAINFLTGKASDKIKAKIRAHKELIQRNMSLIDLTNINVNDLTKNVLSMDHKVDKAAMMAELTKLGLTGARSQSKFLLDLIKMYEKIREVKAVSFDDVIRELGEENVKA